MAQINTYRMNLKLYTDYIKKVFREISKLSKETGYSKTYHLIDYSMALLRHGCLIRQYTIGNFWKLSNAERSKRLTYPRMCRLMKKYNNSKFIHYLNEKQDFNSYFKDFIHRDWLEVSKASYEVFYDFINRHKTIIIKPINGVEGGGIRKYIFSGESDLTDLFEKLQSENVLIEECIVQHPKMVFGNTSVNTIRTMTLFGKDGKGHVVKAMLRAGVGDTVALVSAGNLIVEDLYLREISHNKLILKTGENSLSELTLELPFDTPVTSEIPLKKHFRFLRSRCSLPVQSLLHLLQAP